MSCFQILISPAMDTTHCCACNASLPDDGKTRKRNRSRKCKACNTTAALKRRKQNPYLLLSHRFNNSCRRLGITDNRLWATQTVKYVMDRWNGKSVLSNESNPELLCIVSYFDTAVVPLKKEHLVLATSREAQSLARAKDRTLRFPEEVRRVMEPPK